MLILFGLLCLQTVPEIDRAEIMTGGAFRPGHWAPLEIGIKTASPFEGELVVRTDIGFSIVRSVRLSTGTSHFVLPALALSVDAPLEVTLRRGDSVVSRFARKRLGLGLYQSDLLVLAEGASPGSKTVVFDWTPKASRLEWFEAVDAVVGDAPAGYEEMGGIVAEDLADAMARLRARGKHESRWFEPVDPAVHRLAPKEGWIVGQRNFLVWFSVLYLLGAVLLLGGVALWRPRFRWWAVILLPSAACAVAYFGFPGGSVVVVRQSCSIGRARADIWFVHKARPGKMEVAFPGLVKPLFDSWQQAKSSRFEMVVEENLTRVGKEAGSWFACSRIHGDVDENRIRARRSGSRLHVTGPILDGEALVDGVTVLVGDVPEKAGVELRGESGSEDPVYRYYRRKIIRDGNFLYGRSTREVKMGTGIEARDLAEIRDEPRVMVQSIEEE